MKKNRQLFTDTSTDSIFRTDEISLDWWQDKKRGWHTFCWILVIIGIIFVVGLVIYFLMIDMKVMSPVLTNSHDGQQLFDEFRTIVSETPTNDVVALDGNIILDLGGVTYHEGTQHVTKQPNEKDIAMPINASQQDFMEIIPAPNLGSSTLDDKVEISEESIFTSTPNAPHTNSISVTRQSSEGASLETSGFIPTYDAKLFYPASKVYHKSVITQDGKLSEKTYNDTESGTALPLIKKDNRTNKLIQNEENKKQFTPTIRRPVYPTLPSSTPVLHDISEVLHQNSSESLCFSPQLNMCRGTLPYDLTTVPSIPGINKLSDLDAALPYFELIIESGCSVRAQQYLCSILEPECRPEGDKLLPPCYKICKAVAEDCRDFLLSVLDLSQIFECDQYPDSDDPSKCVNWARGEACLTNEFHCPDGTCIPDRWQCDGLSDCRFSEDETNCTNCQDEDFKCDIDQKCIPYHWKCDGQKDCSDGSDEADCLIQEESQLTAMPHTSPCPNGELRCLDGRCITMQQLCDGKKDCSDGADEVNCSVNT